MAQKDKLIGRKSEIERFDSIMNERESVFVVVYGRRRVGKTFLVNSYFDEKFAFKCTGLSVKGKQEQLQNFCASLNKYAEEPVFQTPKNWFEAFDSLRQLLENKRTNEKKVVFIDELPWMDTPKSNLVTALEHFWNDWGVAQDNLVFVLCGSATSWITRKILRNHGGLHNRTDHRIYIRPFTLAESREYLINRNIEFTNRDILEAYMAMGGIPFYLKQIQRGKSIAQNIDEMFFIRNGRLENEYDELFASLYDNPEPYLKVVEALSGKNKGLAKDEIVSATKLIDNGHLKAILDDLDNCNIIRRYRGYEKLSKESLYQLIDPFTLFHNRFIRKFGHSDKDVWRYQVGTAPYQSWIGIAFEQVCLLHHIQIERKLQIAGIMTEVFAWSHNDKEDGKAQIDLLIKRADKIVNVCEIKYRESEFAFTKKDADDLVRRIRIFREVNKIRYAIHPVLITTYGLKHNEYASLVQNVVVMDDLFE